MNLPNAISLSRIFFSPIFFISFFIPEWFNLPCLPYLITCWVLFFIIELSDLLDGLIARRNNAVSDLGKVLDPFADSISRLTYFICLMGVGILPLWMLLIFIYRDISVSFIRLLLVKKGVVQGAKWSGKIKAWLYAIFAFIGIAYFSMKRLLPTLPIYDIFNLVVQIGFYLCILVAVVSLLDYLFVLLKKKN
ncbi:MAG: CDP-diacylglycerol--glycerol-3-phosphate 3-phosphatidyltransferase [Spirochaetales bacterium]|nr:CDP-diacylglycerol--glycerol-3-phosphate 3-phosphatidyltransferase [Spirochaetales bacterium]